MCRDDRGQALALLVAALGFAAFVVGAVVETDTRLLNRLHATRAAEAAAEAAGGVAADLMLELRAEALQDHRAVDVIDAALADPLLAARAKGAARQVLASMGADLTRLTLNRRSTELSAKAEVHSRNADGLARVGVQPP